MSDKGDLPRVTNAFKNHDGVLEALETRYDPQTALQRKLWSTFPESFGIRGGRRVPILPFAVSYVIRELARFLGGENAEHTAPQYLLTGERASTDTEDESQRVDFWLVYRRHSLVVTVGSIPYKNPETNRMEVEHAFVIVSFCRNHGVYHLGKKRPLTKKKAAAKSYVVDQRFRRDRTDKSEHLLGIGELFSVFTSEELLGYQDLKYPKTEQDSSKLRSALDCCGYFLTGQAELADQVPFSDWVTSRMYSLKRQSSRLAKHALRSPDAEGEPDDDDEEDGWDEE